MPTIWPGSTWFGFTGGSTERVRVGDVWSSAPLPVVVKVLFHVLNRAFPWVSRQSWVITTVYSVLGANLFVSPSCSCHTATVFSLGVPSKSLLVRTWPGTRFPAGSYTLKLPPWPVAMVPSLMGLLKKAVTAESMLTPRAFGPGSTLTVGIPAGAASSGWNCPTRHPLLPTSTWRVMF